MPSTYTPIATNTLASNTGTVTFSSIPSTYTDVVLVMNIKGTVDSIPYIRLNSDTGTNYSYTNIEGNGTSATSGRSSSQSFMFITNSSQYTSNNFSFNNISHFMNYSNTSVNKTVLSRTNAAASATEIYAGLWRSTSAIDTISISAYDGSLAIGSTFTIYGIKAA